MGLPRHEQRILHEIERELERESPELIRLTAILSSRKPGRRPSRPASVRHSPSGTGPKRYGFSLGRWETTAVCGAVVAVVLTLILITLIVPYIR